MGPFEYPVTSAYYSTPQLSWRMDRYRHRVIIPSVKDRRHVIENRHHHRPDLLANEIYGSAEYWWVFASRNMNVIRDPIFDFEAGREIIIPDTTSVRAARGVV